MLASFDNTGNSDSWMPNSRQITRSGSHVSNPKSLNTILPSYSHSAKSPFQPRKSDHISTNPVNLFVTSNEIPRVSAKQTSMLFWRNMKLVAPLSLRTKSRNGPRLSTGPSPMKPNVVCMPTSAIKQKKEERSGLQHVNVPSDSIQKDTPAYSLLQSTAPSDVVWEKVIDRVAIERQILRYNRDSFRAAAESPCGHCHIHDELTFTSLSPAATALLAGHIPPSWNATSPTLKAFLASFAIPPDVLSAPPISTTFTDDDVSKGFRRWRETTTTSPSGRHLGHYKALISDLSLQMKSTVMTSCGETAGTFVCADPIDITINTLF